MYGQQRRKVPTLRHFRSVDLPPTFAKQNSSADTLSPLISSEDDLHFWAPMAGTLRPLPDICAICLSEVEVIGFSSIQKSNDPVSCRKYSCRSRRQTPERSLTTLASTKVTISFFTLVLKEFECIACTPAKLFVYSETMKKHPCLNSWRSWSTTSTYPTSAHISLQLYIRKCLRRISRWSHLRHPPAKVPSCASIL